MKEQNTAMIYNVLVAGISVGMTFNVTEAREWQKGSMHPDTKVVPVPYTADRAKYRQWKVE